MKKLILLTVAALLIGGAAWGQTFPTPDQPSGTDPLTPVDDRLVRGMLFSEGLFDAFYAPPTLSTESRYSAGIFGSYVDDFIDVNYYDPQVGTFLFAGGYPSAATVDATDSVTGADPRYALSFGLAKSLNNLYLAVYYGGSLVNSDGDYVKDGTPEEVSETHWRNRLAVTLGTANAGAFRFDVILDTDVANNEVDDETTAKVRTNGPSFALTWGGIQLSGLDPYVTLGYKFADQQKTLQGNDEVTYTSNDRLGLQAGVNYDLNENASFYGDLSFNYQFADSLDGTSQDYKAGGGWALGLRGGYKQTATFGKVSVGFKPELTIGYGSFSGENTSGYNSDGADNSMVEVGIGTDLGLRYAHNEKFSFYTGANLQMFDWIYDIYSGPGSAETSIYKVSGMEWNSENFGSAGSNLGFGMTFTPVENLVVGAGLNTLLDRFFVVDLANMTVATGTFFNNSGAGNLGDWATGLVRGVKFDLTVSYKF